MTTQQPKTAWAWTLSTFFGAGYLKPGPGTYGSIFAVLLWYGAAHLFHPYRLPLILSTAIAAVLITSIGIPASTITAREASTKDPGFIVIDEVAGQLFALILAPPDWRHAAFDLLLFRLFDIWKPWPIRRLEALLAGAGIMLDDVAAGILALITSTVLSYLHSHL